MWKFKIYKLENIGFQDSYKRKGKKEKRRRRLYEMTVHIVHTSLVISRDPHRRTISSWLKLNVTSWYFFFFFFGETVTSWYLVALPNGKYPIISNSQI